MLGHFGVLEDLLSHPPEPHDPVDSITRQLRRNLVLLDHHRPPRAGLGLDASPNATAAQVISHLYSYRSAVAHGGEGAGPVTWLESRRPPGWTGWWFSG
jgi:hypothetical protein